MHYRVISYVNLPKTYEDSILAQFVVQHATDSNRISRVSSVCDVITLIKFLSVGLLLVNCRLTVGILPADSWPTVYRQTFRGAVLHFLQTFMNERLLSSRRNGKIGEEVTGTNFIMLPS